MNSLIFRRKLYEGESLDNSASEIYLPHVKEVCAAFARANTAEAASRKLAVKTLWRCAGRASEPGKINWGSIVWNAHFDCPVGDSPQPKVSKMKKIPFIAGSDRHSDWALDVGDDLCLQRGSMTWRSQQITPLLPDLTSDGSGTKIGDYLKGLQPTGCQGSIAKYKAVHIQSLPPRPTAAGFRPGAADTMATCMPAELAVHTTGHDLKGISALWDYLEQRIALCMPGAQNLPQEPALGALAASPARLSAPAGWLRVCPPSARPRELGSGAGLRDCYAPQLRSLTLTLTRPSPSPPP